MISRLAGRSRSRSRALPDAIAPLMALAVVVGLAGCSGDLTTGPGGGTPASFVQEISVSDLHGIIGDSVARLRVELIPGGLTASRVVVQEADAREKDEWIRSRIVDLSVSGDAGTVTLALGGLQIAIDPDTHFFLEEGDATMAGFVERLQALLADGHEPAVEVRRDPPVDPQAPDDGSFRAAVIALGEGGGPKFSLNVGPDNIQLNDAAGPDQPDAWLAVLGLTIELRVSDGTTQIEVEQDEFSDEAEFEGRVDSVDLDAGTFTLADGTIVRVVDATHIQGHTDADPHTLEAVHAALEAGTVVKAWGHGGVESKDPLTLTAIDVTFAASDDGVDRVEFEGHVESVDPNAGTFQLGDGTVVQLSETTEIVGYGENGLTSLPAVQDALDAGKTVVAWGKAEVASEDPPVLTAIRVVFAYGEGDDTGTEFQGVVASVDLGEATATLQDGTVIQIDAETQICAGDDHGLDSLEAVQAALEADQTVLAQGEGKLVSEEPRTITASKITFSLDGGGP